MGVRVKNGGGRGTLTLQAEASTSGSIAPVSMEARAKSRSYIRWKFSQNSGVIPNTLTPSPTSATHALG